MNRARVAERAAQNGFQKPHLHQSGASPSTNLLLRTEPTDVVKPVRKSRALKMTGAARCASGSGKRSLWAASQNYRTGVTVDSRWSA